MLRVGYVPGVTPDKWARAWRERRDGVRLELVLVEEADAEQAVRDKRIDMALARLPVDRTGLHLVRLYDELPVVVVNREHPAAAYDEIELADLADEQFITPSRAQITSSPRQCRPRRRSKWQPPAPGSQCCRCRLPGCITART